MTKAHEDVAAAAMAMPPEARVELAEMLLSSVDTAERAAVDAAWGSEAERRIDQLERGEAKLIPGDKVMNELRKRAR